MRRLTILFHFILISEVSFSQDILQWADVYQPSVNMYTDGEVEVDKSNNVYVSYWYSVTYRN
jgi:hypothetical protein